MRKFSILSKKKFTDGLESVFGAVNEETFDRGLLVDEPVGPSDKDKSKKKDKKGANTTTRKKKSVSRKSFTTDLDSLFDAAFSDKIDSQLEERQPQAATLKGKSKSLKNTSRTVAPLSGLDALIRQTIDSGTLNYDPKKKKRVTFTCEKDKLDKLKSIAKKEKAYLKDILGEIVANFIQEYEDNKDRKN